MQKVINQLIQFQELIEARAQQSATSSNGRLDQLNKSIKLFQEQLPESLAAKFLRIQQRHHIAIVPMSNNACTGCGMAIPVSLQHSIKAAKDIYACPNCARLLYAPSKELPKRISQRTRRFGVAVQAGLSRFSSQNLMIAQTKAQSKEEVIEELANLMQEHQFIDDAKALTEAALRREAIVSTALDHGVAFPHVRGVEGGGLTVAIATSKKGFKFDADAKKLTRIVVFVVIPTAASAFYLKLLSGMTQSFQKKETREKIYEAKDGEKLWKTMLTVTKNTIK